MTSALIVKEIILVGVNNAAWFKKKSEAPNHPDCVIPNIIPKLLVQNARNTTGRNQQPITVTDSDILFGRFDGTCKKHLNKRRMAK